MLSELSQSEVGWLELTGQPDREVEEAWIRPPLLCSLRSNARHELPGFHVYLSSTEAGS